LAARSSCRQRGRKHSNGAEGRCRDVTGRVHLEGNVDVRPYQNLENLGWVTVTSLAMHDNLIEMTEAGKAVASKL